MKVAELEATAFHESGHCVVALLLNRRVASVTIEPSPGLLGVMREGEVRGNRPALPWAKGTIMIAMAGGEAERRLRGWYYPSSVSSDHRKADEWAASVCPSPEAAAALVKQLTISVGIIFNDPRYWDGVKAIAAALLEEGTVDGLYAWQLLNARLHG